MALAVATVAARCSKGASPIAPTTPDVPSNALTNPSPNVPAGILVGAGDIGQCGAPGPEATARLLDRLSGVVFAVGDNAYSTGSREEFRNCYDPTWGRHRARTRPVPGNHEYGSGAMPYFEYFGANAGPAGQGYYSYTVGPWNVIALNSEVYAGPGSAEIVWLRNELTTNRSMCTAVYWHRPLFSSGRHGDNQDMRELWRTLYEFNADLVINGHDHTYERFAPQDPDGRYDPARGIREFVVGTGGASLYEFGAVHPNSEVRAAAWGVAQFTLRGGGFDWEFIPVEGQSFRDFGSAACH